MAILANKHSHLIVQDIDGQQGRFYTKQMSDYGTNILGGVSAGKGGEWVNGKPVFDSVKKAIDATGANATMICSPAPTAVDAIYEAIEAKLELIICITDGIPIMDMMKIYSYIAHSNSRLIGPHSIGILTPGQTNIGTFPNDIGLAGNIGLVSRTGTLTYEVVMALTQAGLGQSTCIGIGSDPVTGTNLIEILGMFEEDPETEEIILVGEITGRTEINAAEYIKLNMTKPVTALIAGKNSSKYLQSEQTDVIHRVQENAISMKINALLAAGVRIADHPEQIPDLLTQTN
jgi:succinyl-CoA synthetase alpha subunit